MLSCLSSFVVVLCSLVVATASIEHKGHLRESEDHAFHELDPISRELSFDGDIWDFKGEDSVDIIPGLKANSMFGYSVAVYENKLIVGAVGANSSKGGAYIYYRHEDEIWRLDKYLTLDDAVAYDQYGCAVAIYDYTVVIGANKRDAENGWKSDAGAAYIYEKESGRWEMTMDLTPDDVTAQDYFGSAVAIYLNTTVVGCWGCDSMGSFSGAAYVYSKWDGEWQLNEKIFANNGARYNWFGISVAIHDDLIAVGATGVTSGYTLEKAGAAYVFCNTHDDRQYDGMRYVECAELLPGDGQDGDSFGASVAVHGGIVVVGAPMADTQHGHADAGAAYMYYRDIYSNFHFLQKMFAYNPSTDGHFGKSVGVHSDVVVVGGYNASGSGAVYIYGEEYTVSEFDADTNAVWQLAFIMTAEGDEEQGDYYGYAVAVHDATVVAGAYGMHSSVNFNGQSRTLSHAGVVYSYYGGTRVRVPTRYVTSSGASSGAGFWVAICISALLVVSVSVGVGVLLYNKKAYGDYFRHGGNNQNSPISDWLPSSFSKAFGSEGEYLTTSLDSSHGISSSHGMIHDNSSSGGDSAAKGSSQSSNSMDDRISKMLDDDDEFDKDQQLLDDSLSKFQLKRQNRISIKKKKGSGS
mmetsp:Transcript_16351/g.27351  ORF Transcript_16351/g.27351 Transcript_16351/m.27351 type:complete len:635 (+) Transcript_16351:143-2047(+)